MAYVRDDVVALYVDPRGPYPSLVREWYDEARDARTHAGPWPVVAHPPCGPWSSLRHLYQGGGADLALLAVEQVRRWGGVLEHPATSRLWTQIPWTIDVSQCDWGHPARKRTRLLIVGTERIPPMPPAREPTHWCSGVHTRGARGETPPGIKVCSAQQRRRTPIAFAQWLLDLAASAHSLSSGGSGAESK